MNILLLIFFGLAALVFFGLIWMEVLIEIDRRKWMKNNYWEERDCLTKNKKSEIFWVDDITDVSNFSKEDYKKWFKGPIGKD